jgi:hypothetical protein
VHPDAGGLEELLQVAFAEPNGAATATQPDMGQLAGGAQLIHRGHRDAETFSNLFHPEHGIPLKEMDEEKKM